MICTRTVCLCRHGPVFPVFAGFCIERYCPGSHLNNCSNDSSSRDPSLELETPKIVEKCSTRCQQWPAASQPSFVHSVISGTFTWPGQRRHCSRWSANARCRKTCAQRDPTLSSPLRSGLPITPCQIFLDLCTIEEPWMQQGLHHLSALTC